MRVTNKMISERILHNLSRSTSRFLELQTMASSGRRINKPSDDPLGITKDLSFRSRLSDIKQFSLNVTHSQSWLTFSDQALNSINELVITAKDLAIQLGNDTYDENARMAGAANALEIFNQMMDAANTQYQGKYIFSGSRTDMAAMVANSVGVVYRGDAQDLLMETERDSYLRINSFGDEFFTHQVNVLGENADLNPGLQPNLWLTNLNGGNGVNMGAGQIVINTLNGSYNVDLGAANVRNIQELLDTLNAQGIPNFAASISEAGSGFTLEDTSSHHMTVDTPLSMLNEGTGISQVPGTFLIRTADNALVANIDISAATNLDDAITTINAELAAAGINNVAASIHPDENRLVITDSNAASYDLVIEDTGGGTTATDLGIEGPMIGILQGKDLLPIHIRVEESAAGETLAADLGLLGSTEFEKHIGTDVDPRLTYNTLLSALNSGSGYELGVIRISNGHDFINLDLSPLANDPNATVLDIVDRINRSGIGAKAFLNENETGIMVKSEFDDRSFMITEVDGRTASALGIFGAGDLAGNMMILERALEGNNVEEIEATLDIFDKALDQLLTTRSSVGSRHIRAETTRSRLLSQELLVTGQLSEIEDADMIKVITELTTAEVAYQAALASAARMIQPSLMDFLR
ncbi:MAG: flagellar hook-associated protein 3 [candidate division Zixibacteria bacterium]|nr:flagellar hook-associated protein 3 [candidate division Zixibacteria bacterium]